MREHTEYSRPGDEEVGRMLTQEQYEIMVNGGTEKPFTSEHLNAEGREGIYVDAVTGEPLFTTYDQYDAGCGWPSFTRPIGGGCIKEFEDKFHGMHRTEVRSSGGGFHLGHLFADGPADKGGLRYCINGAAIRFVPRGDMEVEGYAYLLPYLNERKREAGSDSI